MRKTKRFISDNFGSRSLVIQKSFQAKSAASIVTGGNNDIRTGLGRGANHATIEMYSLVLVLPTRDAWYDKGAPTIFSEVSSICAL